MQKGNKILNLKLELFLSHVNVGRLQFIGELFDFFFLCKVHRWGHARGSAFCYVGSLDPGPYTEKIYL